MPKVQIPIALGLYQSDIPQTANLECENCYPNVPQTEGALTDGELYGTPGINQISNTGGVEEVNRGSHVKAGLPYFVNGATLYRQDRSLDVDGNEVLTNVVIGTIPGENRLSFADNGKQLMVLDPVTGNGWIVDEFDAFQPITDLDFTANGKPQYVVFLDSFFIVTTDTKRFIKSDANNGLSWVATDFGSAEKDPDDIVAPITYRGELFIAGSETIQSFNNIGGAAGAGFPYDASGLVIPKGVFAPFSLIATNDAFMFIGGGENESPAIWAYSGGTQPQKISTDAIESKLQRFPFSEIEQSFAWSYAQAGHYFVGFSLPSETFVYDVTTARWHNRTSIIRDVDGFIAKIRWRVNSLVTAYGRVMVFDSQDGRIGELGIDIFEEYDENIRRRFSTINLSNNMESLSIPELELTMQPGVGTLEIDPLIRMTFSDDGGQTWSNELARTIGRLGERSRRSVWYRLGRTPRYRIFAFEYSEKDKFAAIRLDARIKAGVRG